MAERAGDSAKICIAMSWIAWIAHTRGNVNLAGKAFQQAEAMERQVDSDARYLFDQRGVQYADYLRRTGNASRARHVSEANLEIYEKSSWPIILSLCHRVLGDLDVDSSQLESARRHYDTAIEFARSVSVRGVLIEALLSRGRFVAKRGDLDDANSDLYEALGYATAGSYRIYEADLRVGLAWARLAAGKLSEASAQVEHARQISGEVGYHWGQVDAAEVLAALSGS